MFSQCLWWIRKLLTKPLVKGEGANQIKSLEREDEGWITSRYVGEDEGHILYDIARPYIPFIPPLPTGFRRRRSLSKGGTKIFIASFKRKRAQVSETKRKDQSKSAEQNNRFRIVCAPGQFFFKRSLEDRFPRSNEVRTVLPFACERSHAKVCPRWRQSFLSWL